MSTSRGLSRVSVMYKKSAFNEKSTVHANDAGGLNRQTILVVGAADMMPDCLISAIEREFPSVAVRQVASLAAACAPTEDPVCLILVASSLLSKLDKASAGLARAHGLAPIALLQADSRAMQSLQDVLNSSIVRGVLPMDMRLDVWLLVLRLTLRGGQYFPATMFQAAVASVRGDTMAVLSRGPDDDLETDALDELTERELQILTMVSKGHQNKTVATALGLSEYTVKIHLHHIIRKLGANNRTGAAAIYHARFAAQDAARARRPSWVTPEQT